MSRSSPFLWFLLGIIGVAMVLLLLRHSSGTVLGLETGRFAQAAILVTLLAFVSAGVIGRGTFGRAMRNAMAWGVIVVVLLAGYTYREDLAALARRVTGDVLPNQAVVETGAKGEQQVVINQVRGGHFVVVANINQWAVEMLIDTGASVVTLTPEDAIMAGIVTTELDFRVQVQTANGTARAAPVIIDRLIVGSIERRHVSALVAQPGMLETSLLGLNFLNSLGSYTVSQRQMTLTD